MATRDTSSRVPTTQRIIRRAPPFRHPCISALVVACDWLIDWLNDWMIALRTFSASGRERIETWRAALAETGYFLWGGSAWGQGSIAKMRRHQPARDIGDTSRQYQKNWGHQRFSSHPKFYPTLTCMWLFIGAAKGSRKAICLVSAAVTRRLHFGIILHAQVCWSSRGSTELRSVSERRISRWTAYRRLIIGLL
jgi:hypothetical protein